MARMLMLICSSSSSTSVYKCGGLTARTYYHDETRFSARVEGTELCLELIKLQDVFCIVFRTSVSLPLFPTEPGRGSR